MFSYEILLLGTALAIDAAVVSFALGLTSVKLSHSVKSVRGITAVTVFGFFQFLMLWLGSYGGWLFSFSAYGHMFQFLVALIFLVLAVKFFQESLNDERKPLIWGLVPLLFLAFATSIDALAAGISFGTLPNAHIAAIEVGVITCFICAVFYTLAQFFKNIPDRWLLRGAGVILSFLGLNILWIQIK